MHTVKPHEGIKKGRHSYSAMAGLTTSVKGALYANKMQGMLLVKIPAEFLHLGGTYTHRLIL